MAINDLVVSQVNQVPASSTPVEKASPKTHDISNQIDAELKNSIEFQILTRVVSSGKSTKAVNAIDSSQASSNATPNKQFVDYRTINAEIQAGKTNTLSVKEFAAGPEFSQMIKQERVSLSISSEQSQNNQVQQSDPLAFDMDGNGLQTTGVTNGVNFDINADGVTDKTSFVSGNDAFLALDKNNNSRIDNGKELFGDQNGASNGYEELRKYDSNHDNKIDRNDHVYDRLRLFRIDSKGNQVLSSLKDSGIKSIALGYQHTQQALNQYDTVTQKSAFERTDGTTGVTGDIMVGFDKKA
ncbi:MAG: hypothetical protein D6B28_11155 [Gammaproteobacteria bacterium]|nr:MAG: hypothetical protein D6B28_11155 [Gammaproteobacteria bacterium]